MRPHRWARPGRILPGTGRITLALLAVVPAVMAYPWQSTRDRCLIGIAAVAVLVLFGWWRGLFLTTILRRRLAMMLRNLGQQAVGQSGTAVTALLQITPPASGPDVLPLALIAGYVNRYGITADAIRVTSRDTGSDSGTPQRDTWIGLTLSATENLAALQARSPRIPLHQTAEVAVRRLADHLREIGWAANTVLAGEVPRLFVQSARERWHAVCQGSTDYIAAYQVNADDTLPQALAAIRSCAARETWTAMEIAGNSTGRTLAVGCALRTDEPPRGAPLPGLTEQRGNHQPALQALHPASIERLDAPTDLPDDLLAELHWSSGPVTADAEAVARPMPSRRHDTRLLIEHELPQETGHPA